MVVSMLSCLIRSPPVCWQSICVLGVCVCAALSSKQWRHARRRAAAVVCFAVWGAGVGATVLLVRLTDQHVHLSWVLATSIPVVCTAVVPPAVSVAEVPVCVSQVPENGMTDFGLARSSLARSGPTKSKTIYQKRVPSRLVHDGWSCPV
jgi:hypothetical protein